MQISLCIVIITLILLLLLIQRNNNALHKRINTYHSRLAAIEDGIQRLSQFRAGASTAILDIGKRVAQVEVRYAKALTHFENALDEITIAKVNQGG